MCQIFVFNSYLEMPVRYPLLMEGLLDWPVCVFVIFLARINMNL